MEAKSIKGPVVIFPSSPELLEKMAQLDPVLDACWDYEVISRDIFPIDVFWTPPIYEAVLQLQEYYSYLNLKHRGIV